MKRIRNVEVCLEGTVTRHGTVVGPAMTSLVGYPELTPYGGGWCGNDIWHGVLPPAQTHAAREIVRKFGDVLPARDTAATSRRTSSRPGLR